MDEVSKLTMRKINFIGEWSILMFITTFNVWSIFGLNIVNEVPNLVKGLCIIEEMGGILYLQSFLAHPK